MTFIKLFSFKFRLRKKLIDVKDHRRKIIKWIQEGRPFSMLNICRHRLHYSRKVDQGAAERQQESRSRRAKCRRRCAGLNFNSYEWISLNQAEKISSITLYCFLPSIFHLFYILYLFQTFLMIRFSYNVLSPNFIKIYKFRIFYQSTWLLASCYQLNHRIDYLCSSCHTTLCLIFIKYRNMNFH